MDTGGLQLDQAPPLWVPTCFFLLAPIALVAGGTIAITQGGAALANSWVPATIALTHTGTLGMLGAIMFGALYQMLPVVAGTPVPGARLAAVVCGMLGAGTAALVGGLLGSSTLAVTAAIWLLGAALIAFLVPTGWALVRAPTRDTTVYGMRLALFCLLLAAVVGLGQAHGHAGMTFMGPRSPWLHVHLALALIGWVGGLLSAVSWQVVPMFYLAEPVPSSAQRSILALAAFGGIAPAIALFVPPESAARLAAWLAVPGVAGILVVHPIVTLRSIVNRRRKRADPSLLFWKAGLAMAPLAALAGCWAEFGSDTRAPLAFGWLAVFGWAGLIMHGMLSRIVPFLVWFHRFSPLIGTVPVPSMRKLQSDRWVKLGLSVHVATLGCGLAAIFTRSDLAARTTGVGLALTGICLGSALASTLAKRP